MIITVDLFDVIVLAVFGALLLLCCVVLVIGAIKVTMEKPNEHMKEKKCKK